MSDDQSQTPKPNDPFAIDKYAGKSETSGPSSGLYPHPFPAHEPLKIKIISSI